MGNNLNVPVTIKRLRSQAKLPAYATEGAAAMDLCAVPEAPFTLAPVSYTHVDVYKRQHMASALCAARRS